LYNWIGKYFNFNNNTFDFSTYKTNYKYNNLKIIPSIEKFSNDVVLIMGNWSMNKKNINRDKNAVKNMISIVLSYIKINIKPKTFVLRTKINNNMSNVIQN